MWWVLMVASQPPGRRASAALTTRTAGSIQWNAVAARTRSNGSAGSGQSSNAAVTISTPGKRASLRRATAGPGRRSAAAGLLLGGAGVLVGRLGVLVGGAGVLVAGHVGVAAVGEP